MKEDLLAYFTTIMSAEMVDVLSQAFDLFEVFNVEDYTQGFVDIQMQHDNLDVSGIEAAVLEVAETIAESILNQHGIFVQLETDLGTLLAMLESIVRLSDTEACQSILTICDADMDDSEKFAELVALVGTLATETLLPQLDRINPGFIEKLTEYTENRMVVMPVNTDEDTPEVIAQKMTLIKKLYEGVPRSVVLDNLEAGLKTGSTFRIYLDIFWPWLTSEAEVVIARDLLALAILSRDAQGNPMQAVKEAVGAYCGDLDKISRIAHHLTTLFVLVKQEPAFTKA